MKKRKNMLELSPFYFFVFGFFLYAWPEIFKEIGWLVVGISVILLIFFIKNIQDDFVIQLRLIFLMTIGTAAAIAKLISPEMILFDFAADIQTYSIMVRMFALTLLAVSGSMIGYLLAKKNLYVHTSEPLIHLDLAKNKKLFFISIFCIVLIGYLSSKSYGPTIWEAQYASGGGEGQLLGNLQAIGIVTIGINYLIASRLDIKRIWLIAFASYFYLIVWGILLRGGRLEFLSGILAIYVCHRVIYGFNSSMRLKNYFVLIALALLMEYIGYLRSALVGDSPETQLDTFFRMLDNDVLFLGTVSGIGSAFANIVHMVDNQIIGYQWGAPYFEYVLRIPPEFLYPGRPKDLSAIFEVYGYISVGGFFEIGEAYLSFGPFGAIIIPGVITYIFKRVYDRAVSGSLFYFLQLLAIISVFMRGAWYQSFAYFKAMVTGLIIFLLLRIFFGKKIQVHSIA